MVDKFTEQTKNLIILKRNRNYIQLRLVFQFRLVVFLSFSCLDSYITVLVFDLLFYITRCQLDFIVLSFIMLLFVKLNRITKYFCLQHSVFIFEKQHKLYFFLISTFYIKIYFSVCCCCSYRKYQSQSECSHNCWFGTASRTYSLPSSSFKSPSNAECPCNA